MALFHASLTQALDTNGDPINAAIWKFYLTGTSTPANVFSDFDFGTSLGATVTANSAGRFVPIYLDDAVTYRAVLCIAAGTPISPFDIDPVDTGIADVLGTDITFAQPGANAQTSDLQAHGRQTVTVLDYIPKSLHAAIRAGTDPTNHTPYLQAMDTDGLDVLRFPAGVYNIDTAYVPSHDQHWYGDGWAATTINCGVNGYIVETTLSSRRISCHDIYFLGDTALANSGGFKVFDPSGTGFYRCKFADFNREAIRTVQAVQVTIDECLVNNCGRPISGTITVTIASPAVVTFTGHGLAAGTRVIFTTTGALPTGITAGSVYYVSATDLTANTFKISLFEGGSLVDTSGSQSGVHTGKGLPYAGIYFDPGATASVHCHIDGGYVSGCGEGVRFGTTQAASITGTTFESNVLDVGTRNAGGFSDAKYHEASTLNYHMYESSGFEVRHGTATATLEQRYFSSGVADRKVRTGATCYLSADSTADQTPAGTGTAYTVTLANIISQYQVGLASNEATVAFAGVYNFDLAVTFAETTAAARNANAWLEYDNGSGYAIVPGSYMKAALPASSVTTHSRTGAISLVAAGKVRARFSVDNVGVLISSGATTGLVDPGSRTCASLMLYHTGNLA